MNEREAADIIWEIAMWRAEEGDEKQCEALDMAEEALEEIQQYRAIGTVEECRMAVEKQTPYKPESYSPYDGKCKCGAIFLDRLMRYCANCGQRLNWEK